MNAIKPSTADDLISDIAALMIEYYETARTPTTDVHALPVIPEDKDMFCAATLAAKTESALWDSLTPTNEKRKLKGLKISSVLHAKMLWLTKHVPKTSIQKIVKVGAETEVDRLIALHYRSEVSSTITS